MSRSLAFDRAPAIAAPLQFLLAAPLFALPVAGLLLYRGPELLAARWSAETLAANNVSRAVHRGAAVRRACGARLNASEKQSCSDMPCAMNAGCAACTSSTIASTKVPGATMPMTPMPPLPCAVIDAATGWTGAGLNTPSIARMRLW